MTKRIVRFTKMHGIGNDYIYVNTLLYPISQPEELSKRWSRPHTGIGADGLVLIGTPNSDGADFSMRIFNADGSEAMMCGNASRCIGKYLYEKGMTTKTAIRLDTPSGIRLLQLHLSNENPDEVDGITVDMSCPEEMESISIEAGGRVFSGMKVSMGNPHFVTFVDDVEHFDVAYFGPLMEHHSAFPQRSNIEFAQVMSANAHHPSSITQIRMRVWERGSGETQACGTGACAAAVAACLTERSGPSAIIHMNGGDLQIAWNPVDRHINMTGPATFVFEGEIPL